MKATVFAKKYTPQSTKENISYVFDGWSDASDNSRSEM